MAKHKAPTQVTIASIQEPSLFNELVERYWKLGVVLALGISAAILIPAYLRNQAREHHVGTWDELRSQAELGSGFFGQVQGGEPPALATFADQHRESPVGGWAKALEVGSLLERGELDEAEKAAGQIGLWPDHFLATTKVYPGAGSESVPLAESIRARSAALSAWEKEHAFLFQNPELPPDAPRVRIKTSKGDIEVGLYVDRAPVHSANFLKLCREGAYDGTKFHRVVRGSLVQAGDPNTVSGEPESWGLGGAPDALEPEIDPRLRHFKGALVAWMPEGASRSNGSQFQLTTGDQFDQDGKSVVFGKVISGEPTLETIESGAVVGDRPQDPAVILGTEVL